MSVAIDEGTMAIGENLSVRSAERVLHEWGTIARSGAIEVDLSGLEFVEIGAGWRLGNAISAWSRRGAVTVNVPSPEKFSDTWFKVFTRSGLGLALAAHELEVRCEGRDITAAVRDYYGGLAGVAKARNNVVIGDLDRRVELRDPDVFAEEFSNLAHYVGLDYVDSVPKAQRIPFLSMIREAIANVYDHAYRRPCPGLRSRLAYASLRRYATLTTAPGDGSMEQYLEAVQVPAERERVGWIEIVVIDDGCGVATRQSQDPEICSGDPQAEDDALGEALTSGISAKPKTRDAPANGDPGYGFTYIADGLRRHQAYAELRTGRRLLTLDASGPRCDGFVIREQILGWMPGTALHIVFPLNSQQLRIGI